MNKDGAFAPDPKNGTFVGINSIDLGLIPWGIHQGTPATILSLQGCSIQCPSCPHPWVHEQEPTNRCISMIGAMGANFRWAALDPAIATAVVCGLGRSYEWVLIQGGEPGEQAHLGLFTAKLRARGKKVALCTSGHRPAILAIPHDHLTIRLKIDALPGLHPAVLGEADQLLLEMRSPSDVKAFDAILWGSRAKPKAGVSILPVRGNPFAPGWSRDIALERGWHLSAPSAFDLR